MERPRSSMSQSLRSRSNMNLPNSLPRQRPMSSHSSYMLPSHLPLRKLKPEPWQRLFDGEKRQTYCQQGFSLTKNKQTTDAVINEEFFNLCDNRPTIDVNLRNNALPPVIQAHIDRLCEQIDDLALQLAEERLNHKQTRAQGEENFCNELQNQRKQSQEQLHKQMLAYQQELETLDQRHAQILEMERNDSIKREEALKDQLEFIKASFHTYKSSLEQENAEQIQLKVEEAKKSMRKEIEAIEDDVRNKINEAIIKERKNLATKQKMEIENLKKQHEKEIDTIHKNFANTAFDRVRVETLTKELTSTKIELDDAKERAIQLEIKLKDLEIQHAITLRELMEFRSRFEEKKKEIERAYSGRLDQLQLQNADLRLQYLKKCSDLVNERSLVSNKVEERINMSRRDLRRKILDVRLSSDVPLIIDDGPRRLSTCATANQLETSVNRSQSAFGHFYEESLTMENRSTDFTMHNTRRITKLRRRSSLPITEQERDVVRYITTTVPCNSEISSASKYDFRSEEKMIKNISFSNLQRNTDQP